MKKRRPKDYWERNRPRTSVRARTMTLTKLGWCYGAVARLARIGIKFDDPMRAARRMAGMER